MIPRTPPGRGKSRTPPGTGARTLAGSSIVHSGLRKSFPLRSGTLVGTSPGRCIHIHPLRNQTHTPSGMRPLRKRIHKSLRMYLFRSHPGTIAGTYSHTTTGTYSHSQLRILSDMMIHTPSRNGARTGSRTSTGIPFGTVSDNRIDKVTRTNPGNKAHKSLRMHPSHMNIGNQAHSPTGMDASHT